MQQTTASLKQPPASGRAARKTRRGPAESILLPALLSRYRDLAKLRHDFPLVLIEASDQPPVRSLMSVINGVLQKVAPMGLAGERLRRSVLALESHMRALVFDGTEGLLSRLWDQASEKLLSERKASGDDGRAIAEDLRCARRALFLDGDVIRYDDKTAARVVTHCWRVFERRRTAETLRELDRLAVKLSDILKSDAAKSVEARNPQALKAAAGPGFADAIDFEAMADLLGEVLPEARLPEKRRQRIGSALAILESQRFFASASGDTKKGGDKKPFTFVFDSCAKAMEAFRDRLPDMVDLVKAVRIAALEIENRYDETIHDPYFEHIGEDSLTSEEIAAFPSYLVLPDEASETGASKAQLIEMLSSDLPIKVLVQTDDLVDESQLKAGRGACWSWNARLASMIVGLNNAFVVQASASHLYQVVDDVVAGLQCPGPALFSVYSGARSDSRVLSPYLAAAAAMESRAFPAFVFNPTGDDLASRFSVSTNPQIAAAWPAYVFSCEDRDLQAVTEKLAFTFVDFLACDRRFADWFRNVPTSESNEGAIPVGEWLEAQQSPPDGKTPYILMVDSGDAVHRVAVDERALRAARRCAAIWRNLQELGGINNSHALALLEKERVVWQEAKQKEIDEIREALAIKPAPAMESNAAAVEARPQELLEKPPPPSDDPYIETPRCTSCDECIKISNRMFAYNDNKQAYLKDVSAGTYRQLVDAAERCKVAIIHPGKPKNAEEAGLDELLKRAEKFNR